MKLVRGYLAAAMALVLLLTLLAAALQPLMPWLGGLFVLAVVYGVLIRN